MGDYLRGDNASLEHEISSDISILNFFFLSYHKS